jgi:DNA-binding NarL/FixJ family response regulator
MKTEYKIYICDDHKLFLESIEVFIALQPGYTCVGNAEDAEKAIVEINLLKPDVVLIDYHLKEANGLDLLSRVREVHPTAICFILTMRRDAAIRNSAKTLGARGYMLKSIGAEEMMTVFEVVLSDSIHFFDALEKDMPQQNDQGGKKLLSEREIQISKMVCSNETSDSIAKTLGLSLHTVNTHRKNILRKIFRIFTMIITNKISYFKCSIFYFFIF